MEQWAEIRRRVLTGELSKRAACREYDLHFTTLQKILNHTEPPGYQRTTHRPSKLDPFLPYIHQILQEDKKAPKKQRHTAHRIFERLRDEQGYTGGETIVKDAVRLWRQQDKEVFLPLTHQPAEAQVDFGFAEVLLAGQPMKVALFVMTLPYSDAIYCQVFPRECTEAFLEGHNRAFAFFGGVPRRISYDNSKIAVAKIVGSRERQVTSAFLRLKSHYLFCDHFCLVRRPNEKGHVERLLDFARSNFLVPVPSTESLEQLNEQMEARCQKDLQRQLRGQSSAKEELLLTDQEAFLDLPKQPLEARRLSQAKASSLSLVRFDGNSYSVPTRYAHQSILIVATLEEVRLVVKDRLIARHCRHWGKDHFAYDPVHYLALLEKKPGGLDFASPLADWELPVCFGIYRRRLEAELASQGTREFIRVLRLLESHSLGALQHAVQKALELGVVGVDAVRLLLECQQEQPVALFSLAGRPHLQWVEVACTEVSDYQTLLQGGNEHDPQGNQKHGAAGASPQDAEADDHAP
jgi:transposase